MSANPYATVLASSMLLLSVSPAHATATDIAVDMRLGPGQVIDANSIQFSAGRSISSSGGSSRYLTTPSVSDITWMQALDTTAPLLWKSMLEGKTVTDAVVNLTLPGDATAQPYLSLKLGNAGVSNISMGNENVSASAYFSTISMTYDPAVLGIKGKPITTGYDLSTHKATTSVTSRPTTAFKGTQAAASPNGGVSIYMSLVGPNGSIAGDNQTIGYENWIKLDSAQMSGSVPAGGATGGAGKPSINEFYFSQAFDGSVPAMFGNLFSGSTNGLTAVIEYVVDEGAGPATFMQLALKDSLFSSLNFSASEGGAYVSGSLNFTSFSQTVWDMNEDGTRGNAFSAGYDLVTQTYSTGQLASIGPGFGTGNLSPSAPMGGVSPVPEPENWAMMLAGLGLLGLVARRR